MVRVSEGGGLPGKTARMLENARHLTWVGPLESTEKITTDAAARCRLHRRPHWPAGGPMPDVLEYTESVPACVGEEEDLLFSNKDG
jgi:hypothetical protein